MLNTEEKTSRLRTWFPELEREARVALVERFNQDARWNPDFVVMMGLSAALAAMGLLQNSIAVVIGAMLVAPLMSPLLGAGFAVVQGNFDLFRGSMHAMSLGVLVALVVGMLASWLVPGYEISQEIQARGNVDLLDLGVGLVSGMVAAYAMARPNVSGVLSGVAIAAALVPPLAVVGISLARGSWDVAGASAVLYATNLVTILLGSALVFSFLGVGSSVREDGAPAWASRMFMLLCLCSVALSWPLAERLLEKNRMGQTRPLINPVSESVRLGVHHAVQNMPGVEVVMMGRSAMHPAAGVHIMLASDDDVGADVELAVVAAVQDVLGPDVPVRVVVLKSADVMTPPEQLRDYEGLD